MWPEEEKEYLKQDLDEQIRNHIMDLGSDNRAQTIEENMRRLSDIENERYKR